MNPTTLPIRANADVIEAAYRLWLDNPDGVDPTWRAFFQGFTLGNNGAPISDAIDSQGQHAPIIDSLKQSHVHYLIAAYRAIGHLQADLHGQLDPMVRVIGEPARRREARSRCQRDVLLAEQAGLLDLGQLFFHPGLEGGLIVAVLDDVETRRLIRQAARGRLRCIGL